MKETLTYLTALCITLIIGMVLILLGFGLQWIIDGMAVGAFVMCLYNYMNNGE